MNMLLFDGAVASGIAYNPSLYMGLTNNQASVNQHPASLLGLFSAFSTPAHYSTGISGTLYWVPANTLDCTVVPYADCYGQLLETAATNQVKYSRPVGAVVGAPGILPPGYSIVLPSGISSQVVAVAQDSLQVRFFGSVASAQSIYFYLANTANSGYVLLVSPSTQYTLSTYLRVVAGTSPAITVRYSQGSTNSFATYSITSTSARYSTTGTTAADATYVFGFLQIQLAAGSYDFTIEVGLPQFETGPIATSPIPTTGAEATRAASNIYRSGITETSGAAFSMFVSGRSAPGANSGAVPQYALAIDDGTRTSNSQQIYRRAGLIAASASSGGTMTVPEFGSRACADSTLFKSSLAVSGSGAGATWSLVTNGLAPQTSTGTRPVAATILRPGAAGGESLRNFNGYVSRIALWPRALSPTEQQTVTA